MFRLEILLSNYDASIRKWVETKTSNNLRTVQIVGEIACQSYRYRIVNESGFISVLDWIDDENDADCCVPSWTEFSEGFGNGFVTKGMVNDSSGDIMTPVFRYGNAYDTEAEAINNLQYIIAEQESEGM